MSDFRNDINALRAVAITQVLLFHYQFGLTGGFVGVDVFFVVSGFLMTSIIWGRLEKGTFELTSFYIARARRIVPALTVICTVLFVFGFFFVDPVSLKELGREALAAILFYSNFLFWQSANYFDTEANTKILLHSWSLSVEWQFYILYPIFLLIIHRVVPRLAKHIVLTASIMSFALAVFASNRKPDFDFYLLPTRAWEMALGGLPIFYRVDVPANWRRTVSYAGMGAIVLSSVIIDPLMPWPAWATLLPTFATAAVISADHRNGRLFRMPIVRTIGIRSYSIYLWHWPILVLLTYFDAWTPPTRLASVCLTIAVSGLSFTFVERNALVRPTLRQPRFLAAAMAGFLSVTLFLVAAVKTEGFPHRFGGDPARVATAALASADWDQPTTCGGMHVLARTLPDCTLGRGPRKIMLFGDSFAEELYPRLAVLSKNHPELSVHVVTSGGCPPVPGVNIIRPGASCTLFNRLATAAALSGHYDVVVIASIWAPYFQIDDVPSGVGAICFEADGRCSRPADKQALMAEFQSGFDRLAAFISALRTEGSRVVLVLPTPFPADGTRDIPLDTVRRAFLHLDFSTMRSFSLADFRRRTAYVVSRLTDVAARSGAILYDPAPALCRGERCPMLNAADVPLYVDSAHIRSSIIAAAPLQALDTAILSPESVGSSNVR